MFTFFVILQFSQFRRGPFTNAFAFLSRFTSTPLQNFVILVIFAIFAVLFRTFHKPDFISFFAVFVIFEVLLSFIFCSFVQALRIFLFFFLIFAAEFNSGHSSKVAFHLTNLNPDSLIENSIFHFI